jgi:uncharacterized membrane protein YphA (DoxX/SURF4 family)
MAVLLRMTIGWHFLYAGLWKLQHPDFSSGGFLRQAKGPLAQYFLRLVPDPDGRERLNPVDPDDAAEPNPVWAALKDYHDRFVTHYQLDEAQRAQAQRRLEEAQARLKEFLSQQQEAIIDYFKQLDRLAEERQQPGARSIPYLQKRLWEKQQELQALARPWLETLDRIQAELRRDLDVLLSDAQRRRGGPPEPLDQARLVDRIVVYSNIAVGGCLLVGLFTRLASLGGGLFLLLVVLAQPDWPGLYPPPHPSVGPSLVVTKEFVEMMALFFLATTRVGRWGGLDFLIHRLFVRPVAGRKGTP